MEEEDGCTKLLLMMEDGCTKLLRVDGTVIPNNEVDIGGFSRSWTLQRYLKTMGNTAAQIKLGVGFKYEVSSRKLTPYM